MRSRTLLLAFGLTATATIAQTLLQRAMGPIAPFLLFWLAIVTAAYIGGRAVALTTLALSLLSSGYFFLEPQRQVWPVPLRSAVALLAFAGAGAAVAEMGGALEEARRSARRQAEFLRNTLNAFGTPFYSFDREWRFTFANRRALEISGKTLDAVVGRVMWDIFPMMIGTEYERRYRETMAGRTPATFEARGPLSGTWYEVNVFPTPEGIGVFMYDRTEQRRATEALVAADRDKDDFLAMLSHELRTPLNVITGWTQVLQSRREQVPEALRRPIDTIARNGTLLTRLVNDLVDISRFMRGKVTIAREPVQLDAIAEQVLEQFEPSTRSRQISVRFTAGEVVAPIVGDRDRLTQVVTNLVGNAVKFTPEGGSIDVEVRSTSEGVELTVRDSGRGISAALLPFVFDPFRQGEGRADGGAGGLGLGLAIARDIVQAHGGRITAASPGANRGATFTVQLPAIHE